MNKTKQGYVAPLSDLLVVRFEENLLTGSDRVDSVNRNYEETWDLGEI